MKTKLFLSAILLTASLAAFAQTPPPHTYDFAVPNSKGDTIWYLITSPRTVAVSYRCDSAFKLVYKYEAGLNGLYPTRRNWYQGDLVVPDRVTWQSVEYRVTSIGEYAFFNCPLTSVSLPSGIDSIKKCNFLACSGLKEITLPDSVRYVGQSCFVSYDLEEVRMGKLISFLGRGSFSKSGIKRFVCPPLVTKIENSFNDCPDLYEVILPEGMDSICYCFDGPGDFEGINPISMSSLRHIRFPNTLVYVYGFCYSGLREVTFPASVRTIGGFADCPYLSSVEFLGGVENIIDYAFLDDDSLHFMDLSPTCLRFWQGESLFNGTMRSIFLPQSLKKIGYNVFSRRLSSSVCLRQEYPEYFSLVIPENVDSLHVSAWAPYENRDSSFFNGELVFKSKVPPRIYIESQQIDTLRDKPYGRIKVYVPCGSLESYMSDPYWHFYYPNTREMEMREFWLDSLCENQIQAHYGFTPKQSGVYTVVRPATDSLLCDTLDIYYVKWNKTAMIADTSIRVKDDSSAFEWTWKGEADRYDVVRDGQKVAEVTEPYYRDTDVVANVKYCYQFIPYQDKCKGDASPVRCYTRVVDTTGMDSSGVGTVQKHTLTLRPNPAKETLFITAAGAASEDGSATHFDGSPYEITDVTGRIVLQGQYNATEGIRVSGLAKGIYLLRMEGKVGKFVKE